MPFSIESSKEYLEDGIILLVRVLGHFQVLLHDMSIDRPPNTNYRLQVCYCTIDNAANNANFINKFPFYRSTGEELYKNEKKEGKSGENRCLN